MTCQQILQEWPNEVQRPAKNTLWTWLDRAGKDGLVLKEGAGTKKEPHRYWLPGIEARWQENMMKWWEKEFGVAPRRREEAGDGEQESGDGGQESGIRSQGLMAKCCAPGAMLSRPLSEASLFQTFPGPRKHAGQTEAPMNARTDVALTMDRLVEFVGMG